MTALAQRLRVAHRFIHIIDRARSQEAVANRQEMLADDHQSAFRQQEVHICDAAVKRILDRDQRTPGKPFAHRVDRILETEAGQR